MNNPQTRKLGKRMTAHRRSLIVFFSIMSSMPALAQQAIDVRGYSIGQNFDDAKNNKIMTTCVSESDQSQISCVWSDYTFIANFTKSIRPPIIREIFYAFKTSQEDKELLQVLSDKYGRPQSVADRKIVFFLKDGTLMTVDRLSPRPINGESTWEMHLTNEGINRREQDAQRSTIPPPKF